MADDIWSKSNFASFRNTSLRITLRKPSYAYGEATEVRMVSALHLGGILGVASVELGNGVG